MVDIESPIRELALFAGAGGGMLGGLLLGWRTICAVERDSYAAAVLAARQNDKCLAPFPVWDDVVTFDGRPWRGLIDVISGGFPCQDISLSGLGAGIDGAKSGLWREFKRIIGDVLPPYVFVENSPALTSRGLGRVLGDLAGMGYDAEWGVLGASDAIWLAGRPAVDHGRRRIWILATLSDAGGRRRDRAQGREMEQPGRAEAFSAGPAGARSHTHGIGEQQPARAHEKGRRRPGDVCAAGAVSGGVRLHGSGPLGQKTGRIEPADVRAEGPDAEYRGCEGGGQEWQRAGSTLPCRPGCYPACEGSQIGEGIHEDDEFKQPSAVRRGWWSVEPAVGRVANGVAFRVDRIRSIGNGQLSLMAALAARGLGGPFA